MAYIGDEYTMRPQKNCDTIDLPVTFDYKGGRADSDKSRYLWSAIVGVVGVIISIGTLIGEGIFIINLFLSILILFIVTVIIRFAILKEHKKRNELLSLEDNDYKISYADVWGIYSIDTQYPYYVHLRNGKKALYVQFEKDVVLGKLEDYEYEHYESIGEAYKIAGSFDIGMCHIDCMDDIGGDSRLDECFKNLASVDNPEVKDALTEMFTNLKYGMEETVYTYDVYVFTFSGSDSSFWYNISKVIDCMLGANYVSFKILKSSDLRALTENLFNLHEFSITEASSSVYENKTMRGITPISITYNGNVSILNKTLEEKKKAREERAKEESFKKKEMRRRKDNKDNKDKKDEQEFDIF